MKYEFWAYGGINILLWPTYFISCAGIFIFAIVMNDKTSIYPVIIGFIFIILGLLVIFLNPKILTKIVFTTKGVALKRYNKIIVNIDWENVIEIYEVCYARANKIAYIKSNDAQIEIFPTRKIYNAIMDVCPYESFKHIFNELEAFKWYHRKKKNKKAGD